MKSSLATKEILSPNYSPRKGKVLKFTPHHTAVVASAEAIATNFQNPAREASSNYVIGSDGSIILSVPEEYRAWTSGNEENDTQAITVEVCNSTAAPEWKVSDAALETLINLGVDVCQRYGLSGFTWTGNKNGTLTVHKMFQATNCPGPYLESKLPYIAEEITKRLQKKRGVFRVCPSFLTTLLTTLIHKNRLKLVQITCKTIFKNEKEKVQKSLEFQHFLDFFHGCGGGT